MISGAEFDPSGKYRYTLTRTWRRDLGRVVFVMLNPSTADHMKNDPTVTRCIGFAIDHDFGSLVVINLYAYRATDPKELNKKKVKPIGNMNDEWTIREAACADMVVAAWGVNPMASQRAARVVELLSPRTLHCLRTTKAGAPKHPLYVPKVTRFQIWGVVI